MKNSVRFWSCSLMCIYIVLLKLFYSVGSLSWFDGVQVSETIHESTERCRTHKHLILSLVCAPVLQPEITRQSTPVNLLNYESNHKGYHHPLYKKLSPLNIHPCRTVIISLHSHPQFIYLNYVKFDQYRFICIGGLGLTWNMDRW